MNNQNKNRQPVRRASIPYGTVNVNVPSVIEQAKHNQNYKVDKKTIAKRIIAFSSALVLAGSTFVFGRMTAKREVYLSDDYIMTNIEMTVDDGIIYRVSEQFYDESYTSMYPTHKDYTDSIEKLNNVDSKELQAGQKLLFPIIFEKDNPHYITKVSLEKQLEDLEASDEYWVDYEFGSNDTISHLAALVSLDNNELYYNIAKIEKKNNIKSAYFIREGEILKIINPKVGELKMAIQAEHEALLESIKVDTKSSQKS